MQEVLNWPSVLLACPISSYKDYCLFEWLSHIKGYTYPNLDYFFVDNSKDPAHAQKVRDLGFDVHWLDPAGRNNREYICESWNIIKAKLMDGPWQYHFSNECDVFAPPDTILRLMTHALVHDLPAVGAAYQIFDGIGRQLLIQQKFLRYGFEPLCLLPKDPAFEFLDGDLKQCIGLGQGSVLIDKEVYRGITFRIDPYRDDHPDTYLWVDIHKMGISCFVDTSINPYHRNSSWTQIIDNVIPLQHAKS